jgi:hypothetical protein
MRLPNQRPSGAGDYTDDATIPGTGLYDDDAGFRDAAGEDEYGYGDEGYEDDDGDDLYGPDLGDDDFDEEDEEPDILESPAYRDE